MTRPIKRPKATTAKCIKCKKRSPKEEMFPAATGGGWMCDDCGCEIYSNNGYVHYARHVNAVDHPLISVGGIDWEYMNTIINASH
jgi:hypothetical protein